MGRLRVVSWNVRSLRDGAAGVAGVLRDLAPDLAIVQEAPRLLRWRQACARLAREAGLLVVTGGRPAAGNLLLCGLRVQVVRSADLLLPRRPGLHRRGAATAVLRVDGRLLSVLGTHLDLDPDARCDSARRLRAHAPYDLVGADVNEEPGGPAWAALSDGLVDLAAGSGPTFSVRRPHRRIDGLFAAPSLRAAGVEVPDPGPVSDHRPVLAELRWD